MATKLDLNIVNLLGNHINIISPLVVFSWAYSMGFTLGTFYIVGSLEINYKSNQARCTLYGLIYELDRTYSEINLRTYSRYDYFKK